MAQEKKALFTRRHTSVSGYDGASCGLQLHQNSNTTAQTSMNVRGGDEDLR